MKEPIIAAKIAKELHKFHQVDIPGSKEAELWNDIFKFLKKGNCSMLLRSSYGTRLVFKLLGSEM